jgi:hypothetical protein
MAYTPTGKPVGRPKTKDYKTISLKMPQELLDRVQSYARLHRQSISELIRDGLEWRITEGDPRSLGVATAQRTPGDDDVYYGNTEIPSEMREKPEHAGILHEIRTALARQEAQLQGLTQALEQRPAVSTPIEYSSNTINAQREQHSIPEPALEGDAWHTPQNAHEVASNPVLPEGVPAFDTTKYALGKLCPRDHNYYNTGQSLLRVSDRHCIACDREKARERRQAKGQAAQV